MYEMWVDNVSSGAHLCEIACEILAIVVLIEIYLRNCYVYASWIKVAMQRWLARFSCVIWSGSATAGTRTKQSIPENTPSFLNKKSLKLDFKAIKFLKITLNI